MMILNAGPKQLLPIELLAKRKGKRSMDVKKIRALQSKIYLKFPLTVDKEKVKMK